MAKTPAAVSGLLDAVGAGARAAAAEERDALQALSPRKAAISRSRHGTGATFRRSCARRASISTRPSSSPICSSRASSRPRSTRRSRLFGLTFTERTTCRSIIRTCAPGRCRDATGNQVGLFLGDYYARPSKRSGAWMTALARSAAARRRRQARSSLNVMNFTKAAPGEPALLVLRRCAHAVPRIRPRACTACCPT